MERGLLLGRTDTGELVADLDHGRTELLVDEGEDEGRGDGSDDGKDDGKEVHGLCVDGAEERARTLPRLWKYDCTIHSMR